VSAELDRRFDSIITNWCALLSRHGWLLLRPLQRYRDPANSGLCAFRWDRQLRDPGASRIFFGEVKNVGSA
jgi:hypothetical protein